MLTDSSGQTDPRGTQFTKTLVCIIYISMLPATFSDHIFFNSIKLLSHAFYLMQFVLSVFTVIVNSLVLRESFYGLSLRRAEKQATPGADKMSLENTYF